MNLRPKLKDETEEITDCSVNFLNYYQDAETFIDKLQETLVVVIRENEYLYKENKQLKEHEQDKKQ